eukprot:COSAG06_NODE_1927_length_8051_cov_7.015342_7_plen_48_part_00
MCVCVCVRVQYIMMMMMMMMMMMLMQGYKNRRINLTYLWGKSETDVS